VAGHAIDSSFAKETRLPGFPIVDAHLHLWDPRLINYPWLAGNALLEQPYLLERHRQDFKDVEIEAMVFVQCEAEFPAFAREADFAAEQARLDPRIKGMVAWAQLEKGSAVEADIVQLKRHGILRGIRRIIQFEDDPDFCLRPEFITGVRMLADHGLSFDICIDHRHMSNILKFVEALPEVTMVLDHIGKPAIRDRLLQPWASQMRELARLSNVFCKVSGVATEASLDWTEDDIKPFVDVAFAEFGLERTMFGSDWPVMLGAITPQRWITFLDAFLVSSEEIDRRRFWRDNAIAVYRLDT
jgi:L-fuconolactonase